MFHKKDNGLATYRKDCEEITDKGYLDKHGVKERLKQQWKEYSQRPEVKQRTGEYRNIVLKQEGGYRI